MVMPTLNWISSDLGILDPAGDTVAALPTSDDACRVCMNVLLVRNDHAIRVDGSEGLFVVNEVACHDATADRDDFRFGSRRCSGFVSKVWLQCSFHTGTLRKQENAVLSRGEERLRNKINAETSA